ncbi:stromal interaction molecule homolog, partial [Clonorchis sinensis]
FVRKEFSPSDSAQNPRSLTKEDPYVSLSDLWAMWRRNPAFGWSVKQTVQWLCDVVHLPQYSDIFVRHSVDGKTLPLLAMQNMSYLTDVLMIRNPIDKRKLMLKALDAILFGSPTKPQLLPSPLTTAVFGIMSLVIFGLSHWFYTRLTDAKSGPNSGSPALNERTLKELQSRLDDLEQLQFRLNNREQGAQFSSLHSQLLIGIGCQRKLYVKCPAGSSSRLLDAETICVPTGSLKFLCIGFPMSPSWSELPKFRSRSSASKPWAMLPIDSGSPPKFYSERIQGRQDLEKRTSTGEETNRPASTDFDRNDTNPTLLDPDFPRVTSRTSITDFDGCSSIALQLWLQLTYALEEEQYLNRKTQAELNLNSARQACNRLHRKRFHVLGPVRLLYSDSLGELEFKLMQAKYGRHESIRTCVQLWTLLLPTLSPYQPLRGAIIRITLFAAYSRTRSCSRRYHFDSRFDKGPEVSDPLSSYDDTCDPDCEHHPVLVSTFFLAYGSASGAPKASLHNVLFVRCGKERKSYALKTAALMQYRQRLRDSEACQGNLPLVCFFPGGSSGEMTVTNVTKFAEMTDRTAYFDALRGFGRRRHFTLDCFLSVCGSFCNQSPLPFIFASCCDCPLPPLYGTVGGFSWPQYVRKEVVIELSLSEQQMKLIRCDLEHLERELQERTHRWIQIESLTGIHIRNHPGIEKIRKSLASLQQPELDLPDTKPPSSSSIVSFELGPPTTTDSACVEQSRDPLHNRMSIPDVVNHDFPLRLSTAFRSVVPIRGTHDFSAIRPTAHPRFRLSRRRTPTCVLQSERLRCFRTLLAVFYLPLCRFGS